jgi:type I restriction enzyme M protein
MNLFLHGVKDFQIVNDDTLANPAFIEQGSLKQFDIVVANPPYSISQWNREAFANDKFGRNFLGTPPQGTADYAFFQHILKSLDPKTGRCAILFPHGVLFRDKESDMREKLIKSDFVECVIGLGANLFFNASMEACIIICRTNKKQNRRGQILIINAVNDVTRKNAQSYLEKKHIKKIADAYNEYSNINNFARVITIGDACSQNYSLNISQYLNNDNNKTKDNLSSSDNYKEWEKSRLVFKTSFAKLKTMITKSEGNSND